MAFDGKEKGGGMSGKEAIAGIREHLSAANIVLERIDAPEADMVGALINDALDLTEELEAENVKG